MKAIKPYLGLDVHKDSITIAIAPAAPQNELRLYGTITHDLHALERALGRLRQTHPGAGLQVAYEAGPCGFGLARRLKQLDIPCLVSAISTFELRHAGPNDVNRESGTGAAIPRCLQRFVSLLHFVTGLRKIST